MSDSERLCSKCGAIPMDETASTCATCGAMVVSLRAPEDALLGKVLDDRFEIRSLLGRGGMGAVYRAYQRSTDREVAIKIIEPQLMRDVGAIRRFLREAKLASQISQPNTVSVFDFGQSTDGYLYLVMELVKGRTLDEVVRQEGRLSLARAVRIAVQLCDALEVAHSQGIIHRDLKPANVMVLDDPPGRDLIKVLDFGIAKAPGNEITEAGMLIGTPRYMSPQLLGGAEATPDADLYAIGVLLLELTSGTMVFRHHNLADLLSQKMVSPVIPSSVPAALEPIAHALLDPAQRRRIGSAAELRRQLVSLDLIDDPEVELAATSGTHEFAPAAPITGSAVYAAPRRRWGLAIVAALGLGGAAGAVVVVTRHAARPPTTSAPGTGTADGGRAAPDAAGVASASTGVAADAALDAAVIVDAESALDAAEPTKVAGSGAPPAPPHHGPHTRPTKPPRDAGVGTSAPPVDAPPAGGPTTDRCKQKPRPTDCSPF